MAIAHELAIAKYRIKQARTNEMRIELLKKGMDYDLVLKLLPYKGQMIGFNMARYRELTKEENNASKLQHEQTTSKA
jgi:hypothetical protein